MNRNSAFLLSLIIVFVLCCIVPDISTADVPFAKVTTNLATYLRFPRGTRAIALGGCGAADPSTPMNIYFNPAVAFDIEGVHGVQGYHEWPGDIDLQDYGVYTGRSFPFGRSSRLLIGGGIRYTHLKLNQTIDRTIFLPGGTGRTFDAKDYYLTLTAGTGISTKRIDAGIGLSVKPVNQSLGDESDWFWTYDMGILTRFNLPDVAGVRFIPNCGVSFLNFNKEIDIQGYRARLPYEVRLGAGFRVESPASELFAEHLGVRGPVAALGALYEHKDGKYDNSKDSDNYGVELTFLDAFSMRVGYADQIMSSGGTTYGMGFGWWFRMVRVQFDVASFPTAQFFGDKRENSYGISIIADL